MDLSQRQFCSFCKTSEDFTREKWTSTRIGERFGQRRVTPTLDLAGVLKGNFQHVLDKTLGSEAAGLKRRRRSGIPGSSSPRREAVSRRGKEPGPDWSLNGTEGRGRLCLFKIKGAVGSL